MPNINAGRCIQKRLLRSCCALQENSVCHGLWQSVLCSGDAAALRLARGVATRLRFAQVAKAPPEGPTAQELAQPRAPVAVRSLRCRQCCTDTRHLGARVAGSALYYKQKAWRARFDGGGREGEEQAGILFRPRFLMAGRLTAPWCSPKLGITCALLLGIGHLYANFLQRASFIRSTLPNDGAVRGGGGAICHQAPVALVRASRLLAAGGTALLSSVSPVIGWVVGKPHV